ncbi:immunity 53 family protein [Xanthomonas medicagonis]|uniref:immunity 53 family protein n=1 Tax=Xanthomonas medicagonis TaxID=3160841 RepID=UPI0035130391
MDSIALLQQWYLQQCNGDWEHSWGVRIETLDNPGWKLEINLTGTSLEGRHFTPVHYGLFEQAETSGNEWISCKVEHNRFSAAGGPLKLDEIVDVFLRWAGLAA